MDTNLLIANKRSSRTLSLVLLLCVTQVTWADSENLALRKPTRQSGTFGDNTADRAVDGNTNQDLKQGSCAHPYSVPTYQHHQPAWWMVNLSGGDLSNMYIVTNVIIYNRLDCCSERLVPSTIGVSALDTDVNKHIPCAEIVHALSHSDFPCRPGFPVRYLSIRHKSELAFSLCEVIVKGYKYVAYHPTPDVQAWPSPTSPSTHNKTVPTVSTPHNTEFNLADIMGIITAAVVVFLGICVVLAIWLYRRRRRRGKTAPQDDCPESAGNVMAMESTNITSPAPQSQLQRIIVQHTTPVPDSPLIHPASAANTNSEQESELQRSKILLENKAAFKRLQKLVGSVPVILPVTRENLIEPLLLVYHEHPEILKDPLKVEFAGEKGHDWGGLTRDLFTTFWEQVTQSGPHAYFRGNEVVIPCLPLHRMRKESWKFIAIGRILAHTAALAKFIPQKIARTVYVTMIFGPTYSNKFILKDFLRYISEEERVLLKKAILNFDELSQSEHEDLVDFYSRNGLQVLPKAGDVRDQIINVAEQQLVRDPRDLTEMMRKGIPEDNFDAFWSHLRPDHLNVQLKVQLPTAADVTNWVVTPADVSRRETKILTYLKQYLLEMQQNQLMRLLAFVTGARCFPNTPIAVTFSDLKGLQRRPIAQTCANNLQLSVHYSSYDEFKTEMEQYLNSEYSYDFSSC